MKSEDIDKLAKLSRIEISPKEKEIFLGDLESVLDYVAQIKEASAEDSPGGVGELKNIMRADGAEHDPGIFTEKLLKAAPSSERGFIKVRQVFE